MRDQKKYNYCKCGRLIDRWQVGAAAVLLKQGVVTNILHFHLGHETGHTVHEAELVGLA